MTKLEELGYAAFAFGFYQDDLQFVSTSNATSCCSPPLIEYLHAVVIAGKLGVVCIRTDTKHSLAGNPPSLTPSVSYPGQSNVEDKPLTFNYASKQSAKPSHSSKLSDKSPHSSKLSEKPLHSSKLPDKSPDLSKLSGKTSHSSKQSNKRSDMPSHSSKACHSSKPSAKVSRSSKSSDKPSTSKHSLKSSADKLDLPAKRLKRSNSHEVSVSPAQSNFESVLERLLSESGLPKKDDVEVVPNAVVDLANMQTASEVTELTDSPVKQEQSMWLPGLNLYKRDKQIIESSFEWLTDSIIDAAQQLLKKQTGISGFMTPQLAKRKEMFPPVPPRTPFIQVIHADGCHWITVSNIDVCSKTEFRDAVAIYDSSLSGSVSLSTKKVICSLVHSRSDTIIFDVANCMSQPNGSDCGVYAIAAATELAYGYDPVFCHWDTINMRAHLLSCLELGTIDRFPTTKRRRVRMRIRTSIPEELYCKCRMVNDPKQPMICCSNCRKYFHMLCESVDPNDSYKGKKWFCSSCKEELSALNGFDA